MNFKIGFMSLVVVASVFFVILLVPEIVEAQKECFGLCRQVGNCTDTCTSKGYRVGQCVAWDYDDPKMCRCS
ncbi:unnamed protein product [Eruca vesicaria subsp. sativa]|uniref:Uncharacterized protein n=1 Tax=Eruca vesicaria subsp. sativa TaxID=29727 RepID=A0ABC8K8G5_ERUVS|nr:unnamed protein product [Eruca vesicaria subsp. sativa]